MLAVFRGPRLAGVARLAAAAVAGGLLVAPPPAPARAAAPTTPVRVRPSAAGSLSAAALAARSGPAAPPAPVEVPGRRTERSNTFDLGDGRYRTDLYAGPVNYRTTAGAWAPIDPSLAPGPGGWSTRSGPFTAALPADLAAPVRVSAGPYWVTLALVGAAGAGTAASTTVSYPDVLPGVTVRYATGPVGVKESLELASAAAPSTFRYLLGLGPGLSVAATPTGALAVRTGAGAVAFTVPAPVLTDAAGASDYTAHFATAAAPGGVALTLSADPAWLAAPGRVFPVQVDPSLSVAATASCHIASGDAAQRNRPELLIEIDQPERRPA